MQQNPSCLHCNKTVSRRNDKVCKDCFAVVCPKCGGIAAWIDTKMCPNGKYVCMNMDCNWISFERYLELWKDKQSDAKRS